MELEVLEEVRKIFFGNLFMTNRISSQAVGAVIQVVVAAATQAVIQ